ncbi:hypothetical protein Tco_1366988, partial [Tanacetum coccineum]
HIEQMSRVREQAILRNRSVSSQRLRKEPMASEVINGKLSIECKQKRVEVLRKNIDVFAWTPMYPGWVVNAVLVKQRDDTWQVCMDYSSLNKVCAKDMYPFLEVEEKLGSLIGYQYKCFLRLPKEDSQVRMSENDEEKTGFHTEEGVYCFTHMLKGLKNYGATLQRVMDKVLAEQKGRNVEVYLEEVVMKSKSEQSLIKEVEEILHKF